MHHGAPTSSRDISAGESPLELVPYNERVDHALQKLLASKFWIAPQRDWLERVAAQAKANQLVDREALDDPDLVFKRDGAGFTLAACRALGWV